MTGVPDSAGGERVHHPPGDHLDPLGAQATGLLRGLVHREAAVGPDDAPPRKRAAVLGQERPHRAGCAPSPGPSSHLAIRHHLAHREGGDDITEALLQRGHRSMIAPAGAVAVTWRSLTRTAIDRVAPGRHHHRMPSLATTSPVTDTPAAPSADAAQHFASLLAFETDCWDVHEAMTSGAAGFVLLDVRSPALFAAGHVPGAVNLPHGRIVERNLAAYGADTLFVVYCAGPHCNGADKAGLRLAELGRPVKKMIGGIEGWIDEGFELVKDEAAPR